MYHRTYHEARSAFREAATKIGAQLEQHKVLRGEDGDELTIDVAIFNSPNPKWTVITSSGLRAHPRQDRRLQAQGSLGRRHGTARL